MLSVEERETRIADELISYRIFRPNSFRLAPARRELRSLAYDYSSFLNWDGQLDESVIAVREGSVADLPEGLLPPTLGRSRDGKEVFLSLRSLVGYWARAYYGKGDERIVSADNRHEIEKLFLDLETSGFLAIRRSSSAAAGATVVGDLGSVREAGIFLPRKLISSAGYFIIVPEECISYHQTVGDTIGLMIAKGVVTNAATYRRAAILINADGKASIRMVGIRDHSIQLPSGQFVDGESREMGQLMIRTRADCNNQPTPEASDLIDLIVIGTRIASIRFGGGSVVPHAGFVITGRASNFLIDPLKMLEHGAHVSIALKRGEDTVEAVQCGPLLIHQNRLVDEASTLIAEELIPRSPNEIVVPAPFRKSVGETLAARCGIGIDSSGRLLVVFVKGTSTGHREFTGLANTGATLGTLAEILYREGAVEALALDSGGSVQLYVGAGALISSGDTRGNAAANFDRALSNILVYE